MDQPGMVKDRPLPELVPATEPFWKAAHGHRLVLPKCDACGQLWYPPEIACPWCSARARTWVPVSGRATLYSWTVNYPPLLPYFQQHAPWPVALVELEEGPRMISYLVDVPVEEYYIGMPLVADFEDVDNEVTLVVFRRAG